MLVTGVVTMVLWAVARPFRRLVSMVSLTRDQFGGIVPGRARGPCRGCGSGSAARPPTTGSAARGTSGRGPPRERRVRRRATRDGDAARVRARATASSRARRGPADRDHSWCPPPAGPRWRPARIGHPRRGPPAGTTPVSSTTAPSTAGPTPCRCGRVGRVRSTPNWSTACPSTGLPAAPVAVGVLAARRRLMPIRTPHGRAAAYRGIWQWPLRSPARLAITVVVAACSWRVCRSGSGRCSRSGAADRHRPDDPDGPGDAARPDPAQPRPAALPPVPALAPTQLPVSAAPRAAVDAACAGPVPGSARRRHHRPAVARRAAAPHHPGSTWACCRASTRRTSGPQGHRQAKAVAVAPQSVQRAGAHRCVDTGGGRRRRRHVARRRLRRR